MPHIALAERPVAPEAGGPVLPAAGALDLVLALTKFRLSALVVATTAVGYLVVTPAPLEWGRFAAAVVGTAFAAAGANALNQVREAGLDARMRRTASRPIPSGAMSSRRALIIGLSLAIGGPAVLALGVNVLTAALGLSTILLYVLVYTPLKTRDPAATLVGAVTGAIPPVMGTTAALGHLDSRAGLLFALLFAWQIPHFLALAWLHREDYARGGFRMLPLVDPDGGRTGRTALLYALALVPVGLGIALSGLAGWGFLAGATAFGGLFVVFAARFARARTDRNARVLFFASLVYLPLVLGLMALDRGVAAGVAPGTSSAVTGTVAGAGPR